MKTNTFLALAILLMSPLLYAQSTTVQFGRHGQCNTGRGICAIETKAGKQTGNAELIERHGALILQIFTQQLSDDEKQRLTETIINSPVGFFKIEKGFLFGQELIRQINELGASITELKAQNYPVEQHMDRVEIHLANF